MKMNEGLQPQDLQAICAQLFEGDLLDASVKAALDARGEAQARLFEIAREARLKGFPDHSAEIRSVVEISNICKQRCNYCNIGCEGTKKYVIPSNDLLDIASFLYHEKRRRVLLLQSGENKDQRFVSNVIRACGLIKDKLPDLELIVCIGNLSREQYRELRDVGVERYLLKIEASRPSLYEAVKPNDLWAERRRCLDDLAELGFLIGSGIIVGLPGQTEDDLVADLKFLSGLQLHMVSASVFIPGQHTVYEGMPCGDVETTLNFMALLRIMNPTALMPTTSSLEKLKPDGQYLGIMAGANSITIHDGTPQAFQHLFPIYDEKRYRPNDDHLRAIVERAGLRLAA
ncbi:radical SAM protein [Thiorhodococcus mannitoliphagus]|uniref:Radical SAM protein n=1 Tax=Thiorhodococcus mannitoliphagus TaxID=329406 RepID=A0A6P1DQ44_9GAMM|nr:radical SAM protein [Thiorhodococcus mannitoliphagus]NEX19680.1 radical SAM protein [Thiorhodococcus mannitoliphagus]